MAILDTFYRWSAGGVAAFLMLVGVSVAPGAWAADARSDIGPKVGTAIGEALTLRDRTGAARDFASLTGENGLILVFSRSLSWCPFCIADARDWSTRVEEAAAKAVTIAVITYDDPDTLAGFAKRFDTKVALLSDEGSTVIKALGILNEEHAPGSFAHGIPHPMVFVIDAKGVLRARFSEAKYSDRPDKSAVLARAFALAGH